MQVVFGVGVETTWCWIGVVESFLHPILPECCPLHPLFFLNSVHLYLLPHATACTCYILGSIPRFSHVSFVVLSFFSVIPFSCLVSLITTTPKLIVYNNLKAVAQTSYNYSYNNYNYNYNNPSPTTAVTTTITTTTATAVTTTATTTTTNNQNQPQHNNNNGNHHQLPQ